MDIDTVKNDLGKVKNTKDKIRYLQALFKKIKNPKERKRVEELLNNITNKKEVKEEDQEQPRQPRLVIAEKPLGEEQKPQSLEQKVEHAPPQPQSPEYLSASREHYSLNISQRSRLDAIRSHLGRQHLLGGHSQEHANALRDAMRKYDSSLTDHQLDEYLRILQNPSQYASSFSPSHSTREIINNKEKEKKKYHLNL